MCSHDILLIDMTLCTIGLMCQQYAAALQKSSTQSLSTVQVWELPNVNLTQEHIIPAWYYHTPSSYRYYRLIHKHDMMVVRHCEVVALHLHLHDSKKPTSDSHLPY